MDSTLLSMSIHLRAFGFAQQRERERGHRCTKPSVIRQRDRIPWGRNADACVRNDGAEAGHEDCHRCTSR